MEQAKFDVTCKLWDQYKFLSLIRVVGRGCGAVGRAVASDARDPQIKPRHLSVNSYQFRKDKNKWKRGREWPIKKTSIDQHWSKVCREIGKLSTVFFSFRFGLIG